MELKELKSFLNFFSKFHFVPEKQPEKGAGAVLNRILGWALAGPKNGPVRLSGSRRVGPESLDGNADSEPQTPTTEPRVLCLSASRRARPRPPCQQSWQARRASPEPRVLPRKLKVYFGTNPGNSSNSAGRIPTYRKTFPCGRVLWRSRSRHPCPSSGSSWSGTTAGTKAHPGNRNHYSTPLYCQILQILREKQH